jgi:uncharacterized membrane protein
MISLGIASAFFLLIHFGISGTRARDALVRRLGEGPYRGLFSLASLIGIVWMSWAFATAPFVYLWGPLPQLLGAAKGLMLLAFVFIVVGLGTKNPTSVGAESQLSQPNAVTGMLRITRHPFLWGTALWATVHLVMNGELRALILFGSLLVLALFGTVLIDSKRKRRFGDDWERFTAQSSNPPFFAILSGRNQLGPALREIGFVRPAIALLVYAAIFVLHGRFFGRPLM